MTLNKREPQGVIDYKEGMIDDANVVVEKKEDGWSCIARWCDGVRKLFTRNGLELSIPHIQREVALLLPQGSFFHGEIVHHGGCEAMKSAIAQKSEDIHYHVFDMVDEVFFQTGVDARPYMERSYTLVEVMGEEAPDSHIHVIESRVYRSVDIMEAHARHIELGYEGSVVKLLDSPYESGKTGAWMRIKPVFTVDCVIMGVEQSQTDPSMASSLIVRDGEGIVSKVHSGMSKDFLRDALKNPARLVGQVMEAEHRGLYDSGKMRHASFVRLRPDKTAKQVQGVLA